MMDMWELGERIRQLNAVFATENSCLKHILHNDYTNSPKYKILIICIQIYHTTKYVVVTWKTFMQCTNGDDNMYIAKGGQD